MKYKDIDPAIKQLFPWSLFLVVAALLLLASCYRKAHAEEDIWACYGSARYEAMSSGWTPCNEMSTLCVKVREYLQSHSAAEARAQAVAKHIPTWLIRKAERCIP